MSDQQTELRAEAEKILKELNQLIGAVSSPDSNVLLSGLGKINQLLINHEQRYARLQLRLKELEEQNLAIFQNAPVGYITLSGDGEIVQSNLAFEQMTGHSGEELKNQFFVDLVEADDQTLFQRASPVSQEQETPVEIRILRKDKSSFYARVMRNAVGNYTEGSADEAILLVVCDITRQKEAENLFVESEFRYRTLVNSGKALIWSAGTDKQCNYFNDVWLNFTGRTLEQELGTGWIDGVHPDDRDRCIREYFEAFDRRRAFSLEYRLRNCNGVFKWILDKGVPIYNPKGEFTGYIGHCFDISEMKDAESRITQKNEELMRLNAEKDKFFSIIAHDLRSPFNTFLGLTQLMAEELPRLKISEIQYFASNLNHSATHLYGLLENLLEWSSLQRGIIGFSPVRFNVPQKIREVLQFIGETANSKRIQIELGVPAENIEIFADVKMFESIIRNLVSNAIKFSPEGSVVNIRISDAEKDMVSIAVRDSGIGMNQEMLGKLFLLHNQNSRPGTNGEPSSGLGLILCKDFVERNGGKIWAVSEERRGSEFIFTLPVNSEIRFKPI